MFARLFPIVLLANHAPVFCQVVAYEANTFPEDAPQPWIPNPACDPERWLDNGWFFQHVEQCEPFPPPAGQQESFRRYLNLDGFIGETEFFIEFRVQTDGSSSEMNGTAPTGLAAGGFTGVNYHFTVARNLVQLIRDNTLPIVLVELDPGVAHTHRLALYGAELYIWTIDGQVFDSGVPEGAYPTSDSNNIIWWTKSWFLPNTTKWDYVRYGRIPDDGSGDFNSDAFVDVDDFYFFQECRTNSGPATDAGPGCRWADMDQDSDVDAHDFALFQLAFTVTE